MSTDDLLGRGGGGEHFMDPVARRQVLERLGHTVEAVLMATGLDELELLTELEGTVLPQDDARTR